MACWDILLGTKTIHLYKLFKVLSAIILSVLVIASATALNVYLPSKTLGTKLPLVVSIWTISSPNLFCPMFMSLYSGKFLMAFSASAVESKNKVLFTPLPIPGMTLGFKLSWNNLLCVANWAIISDCFAFVLAILKKGSSTSPSNSLIAFDFTVLFLNMSSSTSKFMSSFKNFLKFPIGPATDSSNKVLPLVLIISRTASAAFSAAIFSSKFFVFLRISCSMASCFAILLSLSIRGSLLPVIGCVWRCAALRSTASVASALVTLLFL